jgi:hypothetical protein
VESLLSLADAYLYASKEDGRNRVILPHTDALPRIGRSAVAKA